MKLHTKKKCFLCGKAPVYHIFSDEAGFNESACTDHVRMLEDYADLGAPGALKIHRMDLLCASMAPCGGSGDD